jgi:hypothetical protein
MDWMRLSGKLAFSLIIWAMSLEKAWFLVDNRSTSGIRINQYHEVPKQARQGLNWSTNVTLYPLQEHK